MTTEWRVVIRYPDADPGVRGPASEPIARGLFDRARAEFSAVWCELQWRADPNRGWLVKDWFGVKLVKV